MVRREKGNPKGYEKPGRMIKSVQEGGRNGTRRAVADHTRVASLMGSCTRCDASPCLSGALDCQPRGPNFVFVRHNEPLPLKTNLPAKP